MPPAPFVPPPDSTRILWPKGATDQFTDLASATLGNMGTPADGFDGMALTYANLFSPTSDALNSLEVSLEQAQYFADALDSPSLDDLASAVQADTHGFDSLSSQLESDITSYAPVPHLPATPGDVSLPDFSIPSGLLTAPTLPNVPITGSDITGDLEKVLQGLGTFAKSILALVTKALLAIPIYGWIAAAIATVIALLWHGADPNQVPAAMTEQVFELAADGFMHLFQRGYIDLQTLGGLLAAMITEGVKREQALESQYGEVRPFQNGITNMAHVINDLWTKAQNTATPAPRKLDLTVAASVWNSQSKAGWYPQSVSVAKQIYDQAVNAIIGRQ